MQKPKLWYLLECNLLATLPTFYSKFTSHQFFLGMWADDDDFDARPSFGKRSGKPGGPVRFVSGGVTGGSKPKKVSWNCLTQILITCFRNKMTKKKKISGQVRRAKMWTKTSLKFRWFRRSVQKDLKWAAQKRRMHLLDCEERTDKVAAIGHRPKSKIWWR